MKRFKWPLQRLLDVTIQREKALQAELLAISRQIADVRQEIFRRQTILRTVLTELAGEGLPRRIPRQRLFLDNSKAASEALKRLQASLEQLQGRRETVMAKFLKVRASRETLERIRQDALQRHIREQLKIEQKVLDEGAQISFARDMKRPRRPQKTPASSSLKLPPHRGAPPLGSSPAVGG